MIPWTRKDFPVRSSPATRWHASAWSRVAPHAKRSAALTATLGIAAAAVLLFTTAGCESDREVHSGRAAPAAAAAAQVAIPEMEAHGMFFSGQIEAEVLLAKGGFAPRDARKSGENAGA